MHQNLKLPAILPKEPPLRVLLVYLYKVPGATLAQITKDNPETPLWALKWRLLQLELSDWIEAEEDAGEVEYWVKRWG